MSTHGDPRRPAAGARLRKQRAFIRLAILFAVIWIVLTIMWFLSGRGAFWPIWAILGMGIALVLLGFDAYGPRGAGPSEAQIQREMKKMDGTP
jgi:uncharacterized membrane protein